ncbi:Pyridoxal-dependent decarboxylase, sheet domain protein [Ostertagia ostertagi]
MNRKPRVAIRVNMDTGIYPLWDRFGFNYESGQAWDAINKIIASGKLELVGLHTHIGTYMVSTNAYYIAASKMADLAINIRQKHDTTIQYIDMGGGFASQNTLKGSFLKGSDMVPGISEYAEAICSGLLNAGFKNNELPALYLEPGRLLIDDAGYLAGSVIANKRLSDGRKATIMDFGTNILFTSFWYDHKISPAQEFGMHTEDTVLYGPLCMNIDVVRESISLPPLNAGDQKTKTAPAIGSQGRFRGPEDAAMADEIMKECPGRMMENLGGKLSLMQSAALMRDAVMNYTNDSGPLHFASSVNAPATAVFCSTHECFGFGPLSELSRLVEVQQLPCKPCGIHGYDECPQGHFRCAKDIDTNKLLWWQDSAGI